MCRVQLGLMQQGMRQLGALNWVRQGLMCNHGPGHLQQTPKLASTHLSSNMSGWLRVPPHGVLSALMSRDVRRRIVAKNTPRISVYIPYIASISYIY
jgi:hypothetical protein